MLIAVDAGYLAILLSIRGVRVSERTGTVRGGSPLGGFLPSVTAGPDNSADQQYRLYSPPGREQRTDRVNKNTMLDYRPLLFACEPFSTNRDTRRSWERGF